MTTPALQSYFVTATGTDVGKTALSAALLRWAHARGHALRPVKPVLSGAPMDVEAAHAAGSDTTRLLEAAGLPLTQAAYDAASPHRFVPPLSPDQAARRAGEVLPLDTVLHTCRTALAGGPCLIEGVGGVMVPLNDTDTVCDWAKALALPAVLVADAWLGTLSHTLCAAHVLRAVGVPIAAIVLNARTTGDPSGPTMAENIASLARHAPGIPVLPMEPGLPAAHVADVAAVLWPAA